MPTPYRRGLAVKISRAYAFILAIVAAFVAPVAIPRVGIDYPYFFIMGIVLMAWFTIKWASVKAITRKGSSLEIILGLGIIAADYAENAISHSTLGLIDMLIIFSAMVVVFYGIKSFKLFWVPATYGIVLLLGYQLENAIPNYVALQDWMAGVMASSMRLIGVSASVSGHLVTLNSGASTLLLNVESDCTGIQGVLAFGMLSTMALLDVKPKLSRLIPVFIVGFAGVFLINIVRLLAVFVTFEYIGVAAGTTVHLVVGYTLFIAWVFVFWAFAFKYLTPRSAPLAKTLAVLPEVK